MNNKPRGLFGERPPPTFEVDPKVWRRRTRRDVVLFGTGTVAALASARSFLPNVNRIDDEVADITYIRLKLEFVYLAVILDVFSRRAIGWALDRTLEDELTIAALQRALE